MAFDQGHALLIGVDTYQHNTSLNVAATARDTQAIADILRNPSLCGYPAPQVTLLTGAAATRQAVLDALDALAQRTSADDTVFLFYSGHGIHTTDSTYALTTYDSQFKGAHLVPGNGISQQEVFAKLRALPARRVLLIFNACHAGELSPVLGEQPATSGETLPQPTAAALLATGEGRVIITACRDDQYAFVGKGEQTIFARALADGLRGQGVNSRQGYISVFDLYMHLYFAVDEAVRREVSPATRKAYGETQEPMLNINRGVGPFAVSLHRGAPEPGTLATDTPPPEGLAVREFNPSYSQMMAQQFIVGTATVQGDNQGQNVGVNYGSMAQNRQDIRNDAPNQGAQGQFHGPVTFDQSRSTFDQRNQRVQGEQYNAGRDLNYTSGDTIHAPGSQGFIHRPEGPISQNFGDTISGNTVGGDIHTGDVSGQGVAVGHGARATWHQQSGGGNEPASLFAPIYAQIEARTHEPAAITSLLHSSVQTIEQAAAQGAQASAEQVQGALAVLARLAPDILEMAADALTNPRSGASPALRHAAEQARPPRR
jgi:hypothetical protein